MENVNSEVIGALIIPIMLELEKDFLYIAEKLTGLML